MNISVENKVIVILGELSRNANIMEVYDPDYNEISNNEKLHNYNPKKIGLIHLIFDKDRSRFVLNIQFEGESYLYIRMLVRYHNGEIDEITRIRVSIEEMFEKIVNKDTDKNFVSMIFTRR